MKYLQAADYADYLKSMEMEPLPVFFVNESHKKTFLVGRYAFRNYMLTTCRKEPPAVLEPVSPGHLSGFDGTIGLPEGALYEGECMATESCN